MKEIRTKIVPDGTFSNHRCHVCGKKAVARISLKAIGETFYYCEKHYWQVHYAIHRDINEYEKKKKMVLKVVRDSNGLTADDIRRIVRFRPRAVIYELVDEKKIVRKGNKYYYPRRWLHEDQEE